MKLRTLMTVSAILAVPYGLLCVLFPEQWLEVWGFDLAGQGVMMGRMYGGQVFGFGLTSWLARNTPPSPAKRAMIIGFAAVDGMSFLLATYAVLTGVVGAAGWVDVGGFLLLAIGFSYFAVRGEGTND